MWNIALDMNFTWMWIHWEITKSWIPITFYVWFSDCPQTVRAFFSCDGFGAIPHRRSINIIICGRSVVTAVSRKRGLRLSVLFRSITYVGCRSIPPFNRAWMSSISDNTGDLLSLWSHSVLISLSLKIERRHTYNSLKSEKLRKTLRRSWKWTTIEKTWSW